MKTRVLLFCTAFIICATQQASAKIWRVNNSSNFDATKSLFGENIGGSATNPIFAQINDAMSWDPVHDGDTLHVEGSSKIYNGATIIKKVVIIGPGYLLNENVKVSVAITSASFGSIAFNNGSDGSQLIGIKSISSGSFSYLYINVNNIVVKRCWIENQVALGSSL